MDIATCAQRVNWRTGRNPRPGQGAMGPWGHGAMGPWGHGCKGKEVSGIGGVESNMITEHYRFWSEHTNRSLESRLYDILWYFMIFHVIYYVFFLLFSQVARFEHKPIQKLPFADAVTKKVRLSNQEYPPASFHLTPKQKPTMIEAHRIKDCPRVFVSC